MLGRRRGYTGRGLHLVRRRRDARSRRRSVYTVCRGLRRVAAHATGLVVLDIVGGEHRPPRRGQAKAPRSMRGGWVVKNVLTKHVQSVHVRGNMRSFSQYPSVQILKKQARFWCFICIVATGWSCTRCIRRGKSTYAINSVRKN